MYNVNNLDFLISKRYYEVEGLGNFYVFRKKDFVSRKIRNGRIWEPYLIYIFEKYIKKGTNIIDAGAHIGIHSLRFAKLCKPGKVYSFEVHPTTYKILKKNIKLNNLKNIKAYNVGLSDNKTKTKVRWISKKNIGQLYLDNNPIELPESKVLAGYEQ